jgi:antitoxin VapB
MNCRFALMADARPPSPSPGGRGVGGEGNRVWRRLTSVYTLVYTISMKGSRAKLFRNGGSQAVRLPKGYRFREQLEVQVRREGRRVILEPVDEWSDRFKACLGAWHGEIPRPKQMRLRDLQDPFA